MDPVQRSNVALFIKKLREDGSFDNPGELFHWYNMAKPYLTQDDQNRALVLIRDTSPEPINELLGIDKAHEVFEAESRIIELLKYFEDTIEKNR